MELLDSNLGGTIPLDIVIDSPISSRDEDYPERDDKNWLCHSLYHPELKNLTKREVNFSPKTVETFEPKVRTY